MLNKIGILVVALVMFVASVGGATPTKVWEEGTGYGASMYYGSVVNGTYVMGQHTIGVFQWGATKTGTAILNSWLDPLNSNNNKSATMIGNTVYHGGNDGAFQLSGWSANAAMSSGTAKPEALATDGTYLFGNDYVTGTKAPVTKYSVSGTTMTPVWSTTFTAGRVRGLSYYGAGDKVYATDAAAGLWEINNSDGSSSKIIDWSALGITAYQAVRSNSSIYVAATDGNLRTYNFDGSNWSLGATDALGMGPLYGIGINSAGDHFWVSGGTTTVSYWAVPEPSSFLLVGISFAGLVMRRRKT